MSDRDTAGTPVSCRFCQWFASLCLVMLAFVANPAQAAPSVKCTASQSFSVASGGSHIIDLSSCSGFGLVDNNATPLHGTITGLVNNSNGIATYTNNGDGALSDSFILLDEDSMEVTFTVTVAPAAAAFTVSPGSLTAPVIGTPYSQAMSSSGGAAPYNYALDSGTLPLGITVSPSGVISGTVTATGAYVFGIKVTDSTPGTPQVVIKNYSVSIAVPILSITPTTLTAGGLATPYSQQMSTANGTAPYTYVVESGALPPGLNLSSSGLLSGTPTALDTYNFVIKSTDVTGGNGPYNTSRSYSMVVNAQPPPTITGVTPASGPASGGTAVTITGTGFTGVTALKFGANNGVAVTVVNATTMTATSPAGSAGTVNVTVTASGGTSVTDAANQFTYIPAPTVTGISPTAGPTAGGTSVTITGTGFTGATAVTFGATAATGFTVNSATQITATAPSGSGTVDVRVTTTGGTSATGAADQYTYAAAPTVTSISPTAGPATGGGTVTITGTGFGGTTAVTFGATAATGFTVNSATQITATAPAGTGTVDVRVTTAGGTSATSAADQYTYVAAPVVSSISPTSGPTTGGGTVIITGSNFSGATTVTFGATAATGYTVNSATQITATAPSGVVGTVNVRVTSAGGTSATGAGNQYTYAAVPAVTSISPTAGPVTGGTSVTITGSGFTGATAVTFGATAATGYTVNSATQITATAPPGSAGTVDVRVTTTGGTSATIAADQFTYVAAPVVSSISPTAGPTTGGTTVIITGTGFGSTTAVTFGATAATSFTVNSASQITATAPAGTGTVNVRITTVGGTSATSAADQFTYVGAPVVSGISPTFGPTAGGASVTITGANFSGATAVTFGATAATGFTVNSASQITATAPAGTGTVDVRVTTIGGTSATGAADQFTYVAVPVAGAVSATVAYGSSANPITLVLSGGAATSVAVASAASHGTATASGTSITYTPTAGYGGSDSFTYTATNGSGTSAPATVTITVGAPTVTVAPATVPGAAIGAAYSQSISAANGLAPYAYAISAGALPAGLSLSSAGVLSGTPTAGGTFNFTVLATDSSTGSGPYSGARAYSLTVAAPTISIAPASLPAMTTGVAFSQGISATGGTAAYSYAVSAGSLPAGLSLAPDGTLSGTPAAIGSYNFTVTATDSSTGAGAPFTGSRAYSGTVVVAPPVAGAVSATVAYGSSAQTITLNLSGGAAVSVAVASAASHGTATASGISISYTPTVGYGGPDSFTYTVTNASGTSTPATVTITVGAPTVTVTAASLPAMMAAASYSQTIGAAGGTGPYGYAVTTGSLPSGLALASNGTLSGTPAVAGAYDFTVTATDSSTGSGPYVGTMRYTGTVAVALPVAGNVSATVAYGSSAQTITLNLSGGAAVSVAVASAAAHGTATASGTSISYTPTAGYGGPDSFTYTVTNASGTSALATVTITVGAPTVTVTTASLPTMMVAASYSQTIGAAGGTGPYGYAVTTGSLPSGLALASNGTLSGTPTAAGAYDFTVTATDSSTGGGPYAGTMRYTGTVAVGLPVAGAVSATVAYGSSAQTITLNLSGGAAVSVAVASAASHGTATATGTSIIYTPTAGYGGPDSFTYTVTNASGTSAPATVTITVGAPTVTLAPTTVPAAAVGTAYSQALTAANGLGPYTYAISAGALPAGVSLSNAGLLAGTPTAGGTFNFTVRATDSSTGSGPYAGVRAYSLTVAAPAVSIAPATLPAMTVGIAFSQGISATGGTATYNYVVTTGSLPAGLALASNGTLSGTPAATGAYDFTVTATDSSTGSGPYAGSMRYTGAVAVALPVAGAVSATVAYGSSANPITLNLSGGAAVSVAVASAASHGTATASSTSISYTPTAGYGGPDSFTYTVTNASGTSAPGTVVVTVGTPNISLTPATLPNATAEAAYSAPLAVTGGTAPYTYSVASGTLPAGLTLNASTGVLSGTTNVAGSFPVSIKVADSSTGLGAPFSATNSYTLSVAAPAITVTPTTLPAPKVATAYSQQLTASGGVAPYAYTVSSGSLPAGLILSGSGLLSGTPTAAGSFTVTVQAADAHQFTGTQSYTLVVSSANISLTPATLPNATAEAAYSAPLAVTGGTAPYTYSVASGALPAGLTLNASTGVVSGTTNVAGSFAVSIQVKDSSTGLGAPFSATNSYTLSVAAPTITVTPATLPAPKVATAYSQQLAASGGVGPYAYTVSSGSLPAGLTLSSSGLLSGTPTAGGSFTLTVQAADAHQFTGTRSYVLTISSATVSLTPATLANPTAEAPYSATLTAEGGTAPYTFSLSSGSLPAGLSLNAVTGVLSGTTNVAGSFTFGVRATDSSTGTGAPFSATNSYTLSVGAPAITVTPSTLPAATVASAYSQQLTASGGVAPYAYTVSSGSLPAGLALSGNGLLSGTPTAAGSFTLTVQAEDAHQFTGTQSYTLTVASATVSLTPVSLPNPTAEAAYSATLTAAGGTAPHTFSISSGTLPAGLTLNAATGVLSGTTNVAGSFPVSIQVKDSSTGVGAPFSATNSYTLAVAAPTLTLTPASLAAIRAGDAYSQPFTAGGGVAPYAYAVSGGALPTGLVLDAATGVLSGTPTVAGSYNFTVQAKDTHQFTVQQALTLQVNQAPPPVANETATTSANQEVSLTIASTDGSPITAVTIVTPPQHGTVTVVSTGASARMARAVAGASFKVTYVPNANYFGPDAFSYTATGPGGTSAPATVSVTVAPQPVPVPVAKTATVLAGTPVTLPVTDGATGGPFTAVAITTQPASGTAAVNGMDIVYTPGINTSGEISIGYTVSNAFGTSAPVKSTISVNPMPQVLTQSATVVAGLTVTVDLTAGATGGPFTAANILSVAPAEAGKVLVRDVGTAGKPSYQLSFAASGKFAGAAVVSYTLSNAYATSKPGVVNVTVTARRDPSVDPEVIGLQAAQADAARRFASAQLSNFTQRLESLHGDGWGRSSFGLSLTPPNDSGNPTAALARWQADEADRVFGTAVKPFMRKAALRPSDAGFSSDARQQADVSGATSGLPDMPQKPDTQKQALALWLGGAVDFGQHYVNGRETGFRFRTNGVSVGGDYRLSDLATLGVGAGFSHDRSDVGQNGSRSTADSAVAAVYGSLRPSKGVFLDGVLGYGTLQYDASRYLSDGSGFATGERDGKQVFGALVGGIEMRQDTWMWSPYGRVELMSAKLDPYTEKAAGINALSYFKQTVRSRIGALGVRAEGIYVGGLGTWFPRARLEYRHQFQGADDARLAYADLAADGPVYVIRTVPQQTGNWAAGLGVKLLLSNGMTITVDYNSNLNMESGRTQSVMFGIAMPLK